MKLALLSTSDTDLLSARASGADWVWGNPARSVPDLDGVALVVVRVLGSPDDLDPWREQLFAGGRPVVVLGGEAQPSAELMELSSVPIGIAAEAHRYLAEGGPANLGQLHAFLSDTVLLTGEGFVAPVVVPQWGLDTLAGARYSTTGSVLPRVGVLYYRAHETSGNAGFAHALVDAIDETGQAVGVPVFAGSLRAAPDELYDALGTL